MGGRSSKAANNFYMIAFWPAPTQKVSGIIEPQSAFQAEIQEIPRADNAYGWLSDLMNNREFDGLLHEIYSLKKFRLLTLRGPKEVMAINVFMSALAVEKITLASKNTPSQEYLYNDLIVRFQYLEDTDASSLLGLSSEFVDTV